LGHKGFSPLLFKTYAGSEVLIVHTGGAHLGSTTEKRMTSLSVVVVELYGFTGVLANLGTDSVPKTPIHTFEQVYAGFGAHIWPKAWAH
jgi:hypothetical protein